MLKYLYQKTHLISVRTIFQYRHIEHVQPLHDDDVYLEIM
jgi:hypothetical protein